MLTFPNYKFFRIHSLKLEGVKKLWGKEGYLPPKESQLEKEEIRKAVLQGNPSVDHGIGNPPSESEQEITGLPEGEKEKQQLASTLFVGLGSQGSISLVGPRFGSPLVVVLSACPKHGGSS